MSCEPLATGRPHAAAAEPIPSAPAGSTTRWQALRQACRQMFGIPDFDRYLAHMRSRHPDAPVLSEREFHAMAIDRRYGAARPRCC